MEESLFRIQGRCPCLPVVGRFKIAQLKEEALVFLLGAIPGSCAAESENILVGSSSQGGSVKMRDLRVEWGVGLGLEPVAAAGNCRLLFG